MSWYLDTDWFNSKFKNNFRFNERFKNSTEVPTYPSPNNPVWWLNITTVLPRTVKGLRLYLICRWTCQPACVMGAGKRRSWVKDKDFFYSWHSTEYELPVWHFPLLSPPMLSPVGVSQRGLGGCCAPSGFASWLKNPEFRVPESFIMVAGKPALCSSWKTSQFSKAVHQLRHLQVCYLN